MTVVLTGSDLRRGDVERVARQGEPVALDRLALARMAANREIVEAALADGSAVYGATTAVGVLKRVSVTGDTAAAYSRQLIRHHLVAQGPAAPVDLVRATMLRLANGFAQGWPGVRPALAERLVEALNEQTHPAIRTLGSVGQADLAQMADLAAGLFGEIDLAPGEGLALVSSNSFSTAAAALAVSDAATLLDGMEAAGALSLDALGANLSMIHPAIGEARPYPGLRRVLSRLGALLEGSRLWHEGQARNLQDPLSFRNLPQIQGACRDVFDHVDGQLEVELNASQGNPIVVPSESRLVSVANFEILPLAAALDYLRVVLASALSASSERVVKLLETSWSGLPTGLVGTAGTSEAGLSYFGIASQSLTAEARLLAQPVSFELASTAHAEGIEDRTTMAALAARRLSEMVELGQRILALELVVAAQATELRDLSPLGRGTSAIVRIVRSLVPFHRAGDDVPDVEPIIRLVATRELEMALARDLVVGPSSPV